MKKILLFSLLALLIRAQAQDFQVRNLQSMVDAENNFAALSKSKDTRTAFLAYLSDSTILFEKGIPVKGKASWENRTANNSLLFWWPVFVGISFEGDMGFSTGPWQWNERRDAAKPAAQGYYATVWQKMADDTWKMAADIGISFPGTETDTTSLFDASREIYAYKKKGRLQTANQLLVYDWQYTEQLNQTSVSFLPGYFATHSLIERNGSPPFAPAHYSGINEEDRSFQFIQTGGAISRSEDLGYTYGTVKITTTSSGKTTEENKCFLRVWQRQNQNDWRIILDVIGGN